MVRFEVLLLASQIKRLDVLAREKGKEEYRQVSKGELIRRAVEEFLKRERK